MLDLFLLHMRRIGVLGSDRQVVALGLVTRGTFIGFGENNIVAAEALLFTLYAGLIARFSVARLFPPPPSPLKLWLEERIAETRERSSWPPASPPPSPPPIQSPPSSDADEARPVAGIDEKEKESKGGLATTGKAPALAGGVGPAEVAFGALLALHIVVVVLSAVYNETTFAIWDKDDSLAQWQLGARA